MKRLNRLLVACSLLAILFAVGLAFSAEKPPATLAKPDIVIKNIKIDRISVTPAGHNVRISLTVFNTVPGTNTGPFKIKVEWTENPTEGRFELLGTSGVANLYNDPSTVAVRGETRTFDHVIPTGKAYKYIATADFTNQVVEVNESNNVNSAGYVAS
jgi:hypothetical protein